MFGSGFDWGSLTDAFQGVANVELKAWWVATGWALISWGRKQEQKKK